jgi:hypothetical protein
MVNIWHAAASPLMKPYALGTLMGVDKLYHQLDEIHAITTAQLADYARWLQSDPTSGSC